MLEDENVAANIFIEPNGGDVTDEDSEEEDGGGFLNNLSGKQLNAPAELVISSRRYSSIGASAHSLETPSCSDSHTNISDSIPHQHENEEPKENSYQTPKWRKNTSFPEVNVVFPEADYSKYRDFSPAELFELFFDDELFELVVQQSILYAHSKGETNFFVTKNEIKVFLGILMVSGLCPAPSRRLYWKIDSVCQNNFASNAMRRNRFEKIMQYFHFADNPTLNESSDKYAKIRPLAKLLLTRFGQHFQPEENLSHDEVMIEYFGRHGCKQCIRGKPFRFGYKVWCLNTSEGYLASFDLYQGKTYEGNKENEELFGKCGATVLKNLASLPANKQKLPFKLYFDNLFTSLQLLQHLKCSEYGATGTLRENRGKKCPLTPVNNMKKLPRGSAEYVTDTANQIVVCRWMDNSVVTIASTCHTNQNSSKVFRYSQKEKKRIQIDCPEVIKKYNKHMGGTDRQDQNIAKYRISFRGKKWYWCIFTWLLDISIQNAWILHKKCGGSMPQFDFKEYIALSYLQRYGTPPQLPGPSCPKRKRVIDDVRYDGFKHYLVEIPKRRRCAGEFCSKRPFTQCCKCDVGLCVGCNLDYHTK